MGNTFVFMEVCRQSLNLYKT